jgi:asparagine synthase (glutamine-hydrolysing)
MVKGLSALLRYADRNSMAHSREVRLPFLSHELVEFLFTLPAGYKIYNGWTKYIMRKSSENILPPEITWRKDKIGFEPPQKSWMDSSSVKDVIQNRKELLVEKNILNKKVLDQRPKSSAANDLSDNNWQYWMAGNLFSPLK